DDFQRLIPLDAPQTAFATRPLIRAPLVRVGHDAGPGRDRIRVLALCSAPEVDQDAARVRVLHPNRTVDVPRKADPTLAATRFIRRQTGIQLWIISRLHFPRHDAVFDVHIPRASPRTVHAVRAAYHF